MPSPASPCGMQSLRSSRRGASTSMEPSSLPVYLRRQRSTMSRSRPLTDGPAWGLGLSHAHRRRNKRLRLAGVGCSVHGLDHSRVQPSRLDHPSRRLRTADDVKLVDGSYRFTVSDSIGQLAGEGEARVHGGVFESASLDFGKIEVRLTFSDYGENFAINAPEVDAAS